MRKITRHSLAMARRAVGYGLFGVVVTLAAVGIYSLNRLPDLDLWHKVDLDEEFTRRSEVYDFAGYLKLEDRHLAQLENEVYQKTGPADPGSINAGDQAYRITKAIDQRLGELAARSFGWRNSTKRQPTLKDDDARTTRTVR